MKNICRAKKELGRIWLKNMSDYHDHYLKKDSAIS